MSHLQLPQRSLFRVCTKYSTNSGALRNDLAGNKEYVQMRIIAETGSYSSSSASGVVLRHRAAAVACACLAVHADSAAAYCTPEGTAQIRPADGFLHNHCPNSRGFTKGFFITRFSTIVDYHFLTENYFSYHVYNRKILAPPLHGTITFKTKPIRRM